MLSCILHSTFIIIIDNVVRGNIDLIPELHHSHFRAVAAAATFFLHMLHVLLELHPPTSRQRVFFFGTFRE